MPIRKTLCCQDFSIDNLDRFESSDKYGRFQLRCGSCRAFYKFDISEKHRKLRADREDQVGKIVGDDDFYKTLTMKQKGFLADIVNFHYPSASQLTFLNSITAKHNKYLERQQIQQPALLDDNSSPAN